MTPDSGTFFDRLSGTKKDETNQLADYAVSKLLPAKGTVFIATGTTSAAVGERLICSRNLRRGLEIHTHSVPFVHRCMELHQKGKADGLPRVHLIAGCGAGEGQVDLETGLAQHRLRLPTGLYYDYFIWGTHSIDQGAVYAQRDNEHLRAIVAISRNVILLPTSGKFGVRASHDLRFLANIKREKDRCDWHLVVPPAAPGTPALQVTRITQVVDAVVELQKTTPNLFLYDLR